MLSQIDPHMTARKWHQRFPQLLSAATMAMVLSAASGGEARAQTSCGTFSPPSFVGIGGCNDGGFVTNNYTLTPVSGGALGDGEVTLTDNGTPVPSGTVDVAFTTATAANVNAELVYSVAYFLSPPDINQISLTLNRSTGTGAVTKYISDDPMFGNIVATLTLNASGTTSVNVPTPPSFGYYIKDVYSGSGINSFQNTYQTPGPLPILGAGAAFRLSRKLRARVKSSRPA